jgi:hypothetical protein
MNKAPMARGRDQSAFQVLGERQFQTQTNLGERKNANALLSASSVLMGIPSFGIADESPPIRK